MFCHKKIKPGTGNEEEKPIDVSWILYIGIAKMGYTEKEVYLMHLGKWIELLDVYKRVYNFEMTKQLYNTEMNQEKLDSVLNL